MMYERWGKRCLDIIMTVCGLICAAPLMLMISMLIKIFDSGPIVFRQKRVGRYGNVFTIYKFRSMPVTTSDLPSNIIGDIQMTWVGRLIRRLNIDELPQLINILRGEMSVVGPRPSLVTEKELVATRREKNVLRVHPGLTGLAQINSFNGMHLEEKVSFDQRYCENMSFMSDVRIIISTVLYMFKSPPKY